MALAMAVGFFYGRKKRAWCHHLCPIGRVLGLYSRLGPVNFEPQVKIPGRDIYSLKGSVRMVFRRLGAEIEQIRTHRANYADVWMLFLDTGIALGGFLWLILPQYQQLRQAVAEFAMARDWGWLFESGPSWLMSVHPERAEVSWWLDFFMIVGFMSGFMLLMAVVLGGLTAAAAWLSGRVGGDGVADRRLGQHAVRTDRPDAARRGRHPGRQGADVPRRCGLECLARRTHPRPPGRARREALAAATARHPRQRRGWCRLVAGEGARLRVVALRGGAGLDRRMTEMGINVGAELVVLQHQGGGVVVMRGARRAARHARGPRTQGPRAPSADGHRLRRLQQVRFG
jgi:Fe2+ transport system protein FeoA